MMLTKQETNAYIEKYIFKPALVAEKYDAELSKMIDDWKKKCKIRKAKNKADELIKALKEEKKDDQD